MIKRVLLLTFPKILAARAFRYIDCWPLNNLQSIAGTASSLEARSDAEAELSSRLCSRIRPPATGAWTIQSPGQQITEWKARSRARSFEALCGAVPRFQISFVFPKDRGVVTRFGALDRFQPGLWSNRTGAC